MTTDRERLVALLNALDASERCLERPVCRGWIGDWQTTGKHGHAMTDGDSFLLYASTPERDIEKSNNKRRCYGSPRRWGSIKKAMGFAALVQEAEDEGIFRLDRLPNKVEAEAIRDTLGIRKRRIVTDAARSQLEAMREAAKRQFPSRQSI